MSFLSDAEDRVRATQSDVALWIFEYWRDNTNAGQAAQLVGAVDGTATTVGEALAGVPGATAEVAQAARDAARRAAEVAQWIAIALIVVAGLVALALIALAIFWIRAQVTLGREAIGAVKENPDIVKAVV